MYVLTQSYNDYDQHGDYLVTVFSDKPSIAMLEEILTCDKKLALHVLKGGGRIGIENIWYYLTELDSGTLYKHSN